MRLSHHALHLLAGTMTNAFIVTFYLNELLDLIRFPIKLAETVMEFVRNASTPLARIPRVVCAPLDVRDLISDLGCLHVGTSNKISITDMFVCPTYQLFPLCDHVQEALRHGTFRCRLQCRGKHLACLRCRRCLQ